MTTKVELTNFLIQKYGFKSYLEIGVANADGNFSKINCETKVGVDIAPESKATFIMSSDEFFKVNKMKFDIVLLDGLHIAEQVVKDIENSLKVLNPKGIILTHDNLPDKEITQRVPREVKIWTGNVWLAFVTTRINHTNLEMGVFNFDWGTGYIRKSFKKHKFEMPKVELTYENFDKNRKEWLNLKEPSEVYEIFK